MGMPSQQFLTLKQAVDNKDWGTVRVLLQDPEIRAHAAEEGNIIIADISARLYAEDGDTIVEWDIVSDLLTIPSVVASLATLAPDPYVNPEYPMDVNDKPLGIQILHNMQEAVWSDTNEHLADMGNCAIRILSIPSIRCDCLNLLRAFLKRGVPGVYNQIQIDTYMGMSTFLLELVVKQQWGILARILIAPQVFPTLDELYGDFQRIWYVMRASDLQNDDIQLNDELKTRLFQYIQTIKDRGFAALINRFVQQYCSKAQSLGQLNDQDCTVELKATLGRIINLELAELIPNFRARVPALNRIYEIITQATSPDLFRIHVITPAHNTTPGYTERILRNNIKVWLRQNFADIFPQAPELHAGLLGVRRAPQA
jgi:hypothetical protein